MLHLLRKVFRQPPGLPDYRVGPTYDLNGAASFVYQREFSDPLVSPIGPGLRAGALSVTQPPQVYYFGRMQLAGLGGVQAGQYALQPLGDGSSEG